MVAPREDDASDSEGDVKEHVEAEVGGEALVVAGRISALEYLENRQAFRRQRIVTRQRKGKGLIIYIMLWYIHGKAYLWRSHVASSPRDEGHGEGSGLLGLSGDVA